MPKAASRAALYLNKNLQKNYIDGTEEYLALFTKFLFFFLGKYCLYKLKNHTEYYDCYSQFLEFFSILLASKYPESEQNLNILKLMRDLLFMTKI